MFKDAYTIACKEILEFRSMGKKLLIYIVFLFPALLVGFSGGYHVTVPMDFAAYFVLGIVSVGSSGQFVNDSINSEKKAKTLDVLLASGVSRSAVIFGKAMPGCILSLIFTLLSLLILKLGFDYTGIPFNVLINGLLISIFVVTSYFSACVTIALTIMVSDEKAAPIFSMLVPIAIFVAIKILFDMLNLSFDFEGQIVIFAIFLPLCILGTAFAKLLLDKVAIITKI